MTYDFNAAVKHFAAKNAFTTGPHELLARIDAKANDFVLVDVRYPGDFRKSHIPGAITLPKGKWENAKGLSKDKVNILYCYNQNCHLAAEAASILVAQGFPVVELEGGFANWEANGSPLETSPARVAETA
jgi:rhodanese-related sulfurtransferase